MKVKIVFRLVIPRMYPLWRSFIVMILIESLNFEIDDKTSYPWSNHKLLSFWMLPMYFSMMLKTCWCEIEDIKFNSKFIIKKILKLTRIFLFTDNPMILILSAQIISFQLKIKNYLLHPSKLILFSPYINYFLFRTNLSFWKWVPYLKNSDSGQNKAQFLFNKWT
jgi:hypothetical protein